MLTQQELKERYEYNPRTGFFTSCKTGDVVKGVMKKGYRRLRIQKEEYRYHRLVWLWVKGVWPTKIIDHKNGDRANCKWNNLREISTAENAKNRCLSSLNTSGQAGVHWNEKRQKWIASISIKGTKKYLGSFDKKGDAVTVRKQAERKHGFTGRKKNG